MLEAAINDPGEKRRGIALIAHPHPQFGGTLDNKVVHTLAKAFFELGYIALRPNLRGAGKSQGSYDEGKGETQDMLAVADYAKSRFGDLPLVLAGFSFGAFVQSRVIKQLPAEKLVLVAPAVERFDVGGVPANTLVIHGAQDDVVPLAAVLAWAQPQELQVRVLPGAGHFFHGQLPQLKQIVLDTCRS
ncbi:MAG: alpha/beta hydrolase [Burkholderiales bacterium]